MSRLPLALRSAVRSLGRSRFVTALAVAAFALGIGVTTAVFSIFHGVLMTPLPFPDPDELVVVYDTQPACATCPASFPKYHEWREQNRVFAAMAGATDTTLVLTGTGDAERIGALRATASLADVFRVRPILGRWFTEAEDRPGAAKVALLSETLWKTRWAGDPGALGRTVVLNGEPHEVIGIMPAGFTLRGTVRAATDAFVPLARELDPATRGSHFLPVYARLRKGVSVAQATAEMRALGQALAREHGNNHGVDVRSFREAMVGNIRTPLRVLLGAVLLVLLIACANVANLLLAAGLARRGELAIRLALGASTRDLARQLALEGVLLAGVGAMIGVLLATAAVRSFVVLAAGQLPRATAIAIDGRVLAFTALVALVVGSVCGLWPLLRLRSDALADAVRGADSRTVAGGARRFGDGLVVAEVALAFALLVGGGLLVKNLLKLQARDPGLRADRVIAFDVAPSGPRYAEPAQRRAFYAALQERLGGMPGVQAAALVSHLPMYRWGWNGEMSIEGGNPWPDGEAPLVEYRWFHGDYFGALGIPLVRGRMLDARDGADTTTVVINEAMARKFWPGQDPLGRRFGQDDEPWYEVVGVVGDVRSTGLAGTVPYEFWRTIDQAPFEGTMTVVLRSAGPDPAGVVAGARQIVRALDPAVPITAVQTMDAVVSGSVGQQRLLSALLGLFATLAGLLAVVGVYGVMVYNVRRQNREIGIRLALGAESRTIVGLVLQRGAALAGLGVGIGLVAAGCLAYSLRSMLHDVPASDPAVFVATAAAVLLAATVACGPSARAAGRVDPIVVLRDA